MNICLYRADNNDLPLWPSSNRLSLCVVLHKYHSYASPLPSRSSLSRLTSKFPFPSRPMKKQREQDGCIVRSGARIRESIRSLPKGHFQQIRQMFDKQTSSTKTLSTIYERHSGKTVADERSRDYLAEYDVFRRKMSIVPPTASSPDEQHLPEGRRRKTSARMDQGRVRRCVRD